MQFFKNPCKILARVSAAVLGGTLLLMPSTTVFAEEEEEGFTLNSLMGEDRMFDIGGWTQFGYHNRNVGDGFNTHPHRFNLHQQWLWIERKADGSEGLDFGFRGSTRT